MARNPNETLTEKEYILEVYGEVTVNAYSEEDADIQLKENLKEIIVEAVREGSLTIEGVRK